MTRASVFASGDAKRLYLLLDDIDRAGHLRGTASWLEWLRLKAGSGRASAKTDARALYSLLAEIHRLGLLAGTETHARWQLLKVGLKKRAAPVGRFPRCAATFLFWRGRQIQRATATATPAAQHRHGPDDD
jgi:hypothetical protein